MLRYRRRRSELLFSHSPCASRASTEASHWQEICSTSAQFCRPSPRFIGISLAKRGGSGLHSAVQGDRGVELMAAALQTCFEAGGMNVMVNVFTQMGRRAQDELIKRTEEQA